MKNLRCVALSGFVSVLLLSRPAHAALLEATDPRFGLNSLTLDTQTQLAWLDLPKSTGYSYQQALAETGPGGVFSGFRFATTAEVLTLYSDAGIPGIGFYPVATPAIQSLISLLGPTSSINDQPAIIGISATSSSPGTHQGPSIYVTGIFGEGTVNDYVYGVRGANGTWYGDTYGYPSFGNWLVTTVPEPGVSVVGLAGVICFAFRRRMNLDRWQTPPGITGQAAQHL